MRTFEELIDQFDAVSDDGERYGVLIYEGREAYTPAGSAQEQVLNTGMKRAITSGGQACNHVDDDTYEVLTAHGSVIIRRV